MVASGVGNAVLATYSDEDVSAIIRRRGIPRLTEKSILLPGGLFRELEAIRGQGDAIDDEEARIGLRCIVAVVYSDCAEPLTAISISGMTGRISDDRLVSLGNVVQARRRRFRGNLPVINSRARDGTSAMPEQLFGRAVGAVVNSLEDTMKRQLTVSLIAVSLLAPGAAFAQSTTAAGAVNGARTGGEVAGPVGEIVGGTVGAAVGAAVEIPNAVITSIQGERVPSVAVQERVVVGEPLPAAVELRPVPNYTEYRYAVVNDRRVIVDPRTRRVIRIID